jgi:archaellum component FlaC
MDNNQKSSADHIIEHLNAIEVDGETIQYIIENVGMSNQILKQLFFQASDLDINNLIEERNSIHDKGNNEHFNHQ